MKRTLLILACLLLLLAMGATVALAGKGDSQPGVEYNPLGVSCGVPAGDFGFYSTYDWWWATYSNDVGILKCLAHLGPDIQPPGQVVYIPGEGSCGTPAGSTTNFFTRVYPDGKVILICKY